MVAGSVVAMAGDGEAGRTVARRESGGDLNRFMPGQTYVRRKALDAAAELAARLGDITRLDDAVAEKLDEEAAFAAHVKAKFPNKVNIQHRPDLANASLSLDDYCEQHGFAGRTVRRWYKLLDPEIRKQERQRRVERVLRLVYAQTTAHVGHNAGDNEWYTPRDIIEAARSTMGSIDLDPASSAAANAVVKAERYFDCATDGLRQEWRGNVWLNPPYAQPLIAQFAERLVDEITCQHVTQAVVLVNNATETEWFQRYSSVAQALCCPRGRVHFWAPDKISTPLQGQSILYSGHRLTEFIAEFTRFGLIWIRA